MDDESKALLKNFLRRWSTIDITSENKLLFIEHRASIIALIDEDAAVLVQHLTENTPRAAFVEAYTHFENQHV